MTGSFGDGDDHEGSPFDRRGGTPDPVELTPEQRTSVQNGVSAVVARTREYLTDEYVVGSELSESGLEAMIAVQPPIGNPVSASLQTELGGDGPTIIDSDEQAEIAKGLAASAAHQMMLALGEEFEAAAR